MTPQTLHLPDGKKFTVTPVFGGMGFRSHDHNNLHHPFPAGWMTILHTEEDSIDAGETPGDKNAGDKNAGNNCCDAHARHVSAGDQDESAQAPRPRRRTKPFHAPTLQNDSLFISSISIPSSSEFKPAASPTREIAMMLWITLYWYFHQPEPDRGLDTAASRGAPRGARPRGEWKIAIKRDGVLRGRNLIPKLERMGLIAAEDNSVGTSVDDGGQAWTSMFVSKRMFWQIPAHLFLFTLQPVGKAAPSPGLCSVSTPGGSPSTSRPESPREESSCLAFRPPWHSNQSRPSSGGPPTPTGAQLAADVPGAPMPTVLSTTPMYPVGPYFSASHLPTYFPPPPLQYTLTGDVRHPLRPKPPRMGEVFYTRFVDSIGQYLSFRVASCSPLPVPYLGPVGPAPPPEQARLCSRTDKELLQSWFANPRVAEFWGAYTPDFLENGLTSRHSFPVIGLWDGVPFGYFDVYWVREDILGRHVAGEVGDWDRGVHIMLGEEWSRGRVAAWLTSLVHWCFTAEYRCMGVCLEPRVDNERVLRHLDACGFSKEKQVSFPHKQAWFVKLRREFWEGPAL